MKLHEQIFINQNIKIKVIADSMNDSLLDNFTEKEFFATKANLTLSVQTLTGRLPTSGVGFDLTSSPKLSDQV